MTLIPPGPGVCSDHCQQPAGDSGENEEILHPPDGPPPHHEPYQRLRVFQSRRILDPYMSPQV